MVERITMILNCAIAEFCSAYLAARFTTVKDTNSRPEVPKKWASGQKAMTPAVAKKI
jgi:hypothetical protein